MLTSAECLKVLQDKENNKKQKAEEKETAKRTKVNEKQLEKKN